MSEHMLLNRQMSRTKAASGKKGLQWPKGHHAVYLGHCVLTSQHALQLLSTEILNVLYSVIHSDHMQKKDLQEIYRLYNKHTQNCNCTTSLKQICSKSLIKLPRFANMCLMFFRFSTIRMRKINYQFSKILGIWGVYFRRNWGILILSLPHLQVTFYSSEMLF